MDKIFWTYRIRNPIVFPLGTISLKAGLSVWHMVFISDGCSFHVAYIWCKQGIFSKKIIEFDDSFDVTKCLQKIEMPYLLHVCAWLNEQPSIIKTMILTITYRLSKYLREKTLDFRGWWNGQFPMVCILYTHILQKNQNNFLFCV